VAWFVLLDAGPLGLLSVAGEHGLGGECRRWLEDLDANDAEVLVPDLALYEARRELRRLGATAKLARLEMVLQGIDQTPVTTEAWRLAEDFWALARRARMPTAGPESLDADAILAAVAATIGGEGDEVVIATTNPRHFGRFPGILAREWRQVR
jgi:predicted nucleic acid-binding protein